MYLKKELYELIHTDESIFDFILEGALDGLWYWDLENPENEYLNAKFWTVLGYNPDEMPHRSSAWQGIINQDDLKIANDNFTKHCENPNHPYDQVVRYTHKNGSTVWIRCRGIAIRDENGKAIRMLGAHQDVSELKRNEQALLKASERVHESEEKYRAFYNNAPLSYQSLDENGCFIDINPMWSKTLGYERDEVIGKWYGDFLHPDYVEHFRINFPAFKKRGYVSDVQFKLRRKDNTYIYVSFEGCVGYTPEGKFKQTYCVFKDITEQKALENNLIKAKEKAEENEVKQRTLSEKLKQERILLRTIIDSIPDAVYVKDLESRKVVANIADCKNCGVEKEEDVIGKTDFDLFAAEIAEELFDDDNMVLKEGVSIINKEEYIKRPNLDEKCLLTSKLPLYDDTGKIIGLVGIGHDITERKRAEEKLKTSDRIFKHSVDMLCIAGFDGYFKVLNPAWTKILGWSNEELLSKPWIDFVHPDDRNNTEDVKTVIVDGKEIFQFENRYVCKDGAIKWLSWNSIPYPEDNIMFGVARDVTVGKEVEQELKKAKEKAEESEILFKSLFKNAPDGIVIIDEQGNYKFVSPNAERLFGYNKDEAIGHSGSENTHPDDLPMVLKTLETIYADPDKKPKLEYRFKRKNGEFRWIETTFTNLLPDRAINGIVLNFSDITERKQIFEELLFTKEKAEQSDRLKSAFLANMSHEIRTPMNGILGFSELLKKPNLAGEEQQRYISIIEKSGKRMLSIINDIIDISKIEAGLMKLDMNESNINEMIEYVYAFFKPEAETKKIKLAYKTPLPLKEATINTDSEKIYSVLANLVKNAIKYTEKGEIEFGYNIVETQGRASLKFYVKDTGIGIPKERQEAIFERFIQADIEDKMARQGAGLGLAISRAYVNMLGGVIQVESEEGKGSIFYFTLPYNNEPVAETINRQPECSDTNDGIRKLKVLIVEDDEVSEMLLDETVKIFSKEMLHARTGVEAVQACRDNPDIDLILMDVQIPIMDGYEATKQIRAFNKEVIIIAQTAYGLSGDRQKSMNAGCNDYISKPIEREKLLALTQKYFGK